MSPRREKRDGEGRREDADQGDRRSFKPIASQFRRCLVKKRLVFAMVLLSVGLVHDLVLAGSFEPPAGAAPAMRTLREVEPRKPLHGPGPVTIAAPGSYFLTSNINVAGATAVIITASNVSLDLNGFTIAGNLTNFGIVMGNNTLNIVVRNGTIRNF